jgi:RNA polymerase sigma-70 factor (ECF subfamily)
VEAYAAALAVGNAAALERLVTEDVLFEMPPVAAWSVGRVAYRHFMDHLFASRGSTWQVQRSSANHQPALVVHHVTDAGPRPHSVQLLDTDRAGRVAHVLVYYDPALVDLFLTADGARDEFEVAGS